MGANAFQPGRTEAGPNQPGHDVGIGGIDCVETALMASLSSSGTAMKQNGEEPRQWNATPPDSRTMGTPSA